MGGQTHPQASTFCEPSAAQRTNGMKINNMHVCVQFIFRVIRTATSAENEKRKKNPIICESFGPLKCFN